MSEWILFLDDVREPEDVNLPSADLPVIVCRSYDDAVTEIHDRDLPSIISFDHDLGACQTGHTFAKYFANYVLENHLELPEDFTYYVHSANPVGRDNIVSMMENFLRVYDETN